MPRSSIGSTHTVDLTLIRILAWLRACAMVGQATAIMVAVALLGVELPLIELFAGIGLLMVFALYAFWRIHQDKLLKSYEVILHVAVDTFVLTYLLYFTGGAGNPFISLLLIPIALAATALSRGIIISIASLVVIAYISLLFYYQPLPALQHYLLFGKPLHSFGNAINFVIMGFLLGIFINRLAHLLWQKRHEVQRIRERALRDEGILAIATQAAGFAHEINTPLSTMYTLLPELRHAYAQDPLLVEDLALLEGEVERCRTSLEKMVALGKQQLSEQPENTTLKLFIDNCIHHFKLLRPDADLHYQDNNRMSDEHLAIAPGLRHALVNLLNNALEASMQAGSHYVGLEVSSVNNWLSFRIADHGHGFANTQQVQLGTSSKQTGLGLGLALAEATAERLHGELETRNHADGGEIHLRLPLKLICS